MTTNIRAAWSGMLAALIAICGSPYANGADPPLKERDAVRQALSSNLDLKAARLIVDQAKGKLLQAGLLPNPELSGAHGTDRIFNNEGEYGVSAAFRQKFPIAGRVSRAKDLARVDVALAEAEVRESERLLTGEVLKTFRAIKVVEEKERYNRELQKTLEQLITVSEKRFKLAEVSEADLNIEKLELEKLKVAEVNLAIERRKLLAALARLLGQRPTERIALDPSEQVTSRPQEILRAEAAALERRPDRAIAVLRADRARQEERLAKADRWEDWTIGIEYSREKGVYDEPIGNKSDDFLGLSLAIPLPLWNQNEGRIAEFRATQARARRELEALELNIISNIAAARARIEELSPMLSRYENETLHLAKRNVATLKASYEQGLVGMVSVLQGQQQLLELHQSYVESLGDFASALTDFQIETASYEVDL